MNISFEGLKKVNEARKRGIETLKRKRQEKIEAYNLNPKKCLWCNNPIDYDKRLNYNFCNSSCACSYNNNKRLNKLICLNCKNSFTGYSNESKFCSKKCETKFKEKQSILDIESDNLVSSDSLRKYLMSKQNEKCSRCGWKERNKTSNTVCLDLHHKDGDSRNNILSNVELICPNCHSLTNNYKRVGSTDRKSTRLNRAK